MGVVGVVKRGGGACTGRVERDGRASSSLFVLFVGLSVGKLGSAAGAFAAIVDVWYYTQGIHGRPTTGE